MTEFEGREPTPVEMAEAAALGAAMWSSAAATGVVDRLEPDAFTREAHRVIYEAMVAMVEADVHVDAVTITAKLAEDDALDEVGGAAAIFDLSTLEACPTPAAASHYVDVIAADHDRRRRVRDLVAQLRELGVRVEEVAA